MLSRIRRLSVAIVLGVIWCAFGLAHAAPTTTICVPVSGSPNSCQIVGSGVSLPVSSSGTGLTSTETGFTITTGNTFQSLAVANSARKSCTIQNTSSHIMYVFAGPLASATTTNSFQIVASGGTYSCATPAGVITDQISVTTSTTSDTGVANFN